VNCHNECPIGQSCQSHIQRFSCACYKTMQDQLRANAPTPPALDVEQVLREFAEYLQGHGVISENGKDAWVDDFLAKRKEKK
jgi:hypothetical protein